MVQQYSGAALAVVQQVVVPGHSTSTRDQVAEHGHTSIKILTPTQDQVAEHHWV